VIDIFEKPRVLANRWTLFRPLLGALLAAALSSQAGAADVGKAIFTTNCVVCHQANGNGVPGTYPPLTALGEKASTKEGRTFLVHVLSYGMAGPISVHGTVYNGYMQPWMQFNEKEIASVLNYVVKTFNKTTLPKKFKPFTEAEVKSARTKTLTPADVLAEEKTLSGTPGPSAIAHSGPQAQAGCAHNMMASGDCGAK